MERSSEWSKRTAGTQKFALEKWTKQAKPQDTLELCQLLNNDLAATVASHPRRFVGLGTLPMQAPELAVKELERCVKELGFPGVQIGSHINEWDLNAQELFPVYAEAEKLNCSLFVHPWDMQMDGRMAKYWFPWLIGMPAETTTAICSMIMGGVFEKFPKLKVCFAHGGGSFPYTVGRISHGFSMRPDLCAQDNPTNPKKYLGSFYTDSLVHDPLALKLLTDVVGKDKVILGTDYPFPLGELEPGKLIESMEEFDAETKVCAFYFMIFFLNFPALIVFDFRALCYVIAKNREIVTLNIPRTVT
ncbi:2-amino-3-carboxymuconate-6-semialdehyde decarboxylase isoform X5 [Delphinapterus leucas]|uniref:2-amino-3-carboxymuconate-6-semialdehyde decarboxylase n=1 Tax=Delphinapterus leucas TaxID=9749 RepID=A0A2Y9MTL0_DELLE|nr:2-amino-3-carboxymuconate-6-semialdehyde decarboxylase isoform X5 [Delphinapterus leucas]